MAKKEYSFYSEQNKFAEIFFNRATMFLNDNKFNEAVNLYNKALNHKPEHIESLTNKSIALVKIQQLQDALSCFSKNFTPNPQSYYYYLNKGIVLQLLARYEDALKAYNQAISCRDDNSEAHFQKGIVFHLQKKWQAAIESYDIAIYFNKNFEAALTNRAIAFQKLDDMDQALDSYSAAISIGNLTLTRYAFGDYLLINGNLNKSIEVFTSLLESNDENKFKSAIVLAIIYYTKSNYTKVVKFLSDNYRLPNGIEEKPLTVYKHFLASLVGWRESNPQWFLPSENKKIYIIGESHSLAAHDVNVFFDNIEYSCEAKWIMGIKQYHLHSKNSNSHKRAFLSHLTNLAPNSFVAISIGEIDSRINEGYIKNNKKTGGNIEQLIPKVVYGYLDYIKTKNLNLNFKIIIQGIPSPVIAAVRNNDEDEVLRKKTIRLINKYLKKLSSEFGFYFLDIYSMTDNGEGKTNDLWHLDGYHLKPSALAYAFAHHLVKPRAQSSSQSRAALNNADVPIKSLIPSGRPAVCAAIYYQTEAYTTNGPKLMGRNVAGESFLRGFLTHSSAASFWSLVQSPTHAQNFEQTVAAFGRNKPVQSIDQSTLGALAQAGLVYYPSPDIGKHAFDRASYGSDSWSICGITHTTSSAKAMDSLTDLLTAPVQPWDAIICTSITVKDNVQRILKAQADYLKQRLGITKLVLPMLPVIPLGVHTSDFEFSVAQKDVARKMLNASADELVVLFMGRLSFHAKAHPLAMYQALESAAQATGKSVVLVECGWHANDFTTKAYADAAHMACPSVRVVTLDGRKAIDRQTAWAAADVFCSLSDNIQETFGITPVEAMAAGLPVVVSDWDGYKDTVRDGVDGFRIPTLMPQAGLGGDLALRHALEIDTYDMYCGNTCSLVAVDVQATAQAFTRLFNNPELRRQMGEAGRKRAVEVYDWKPIIGQYEALWAKQTEIRLAAKAEADKNGVKPLAHPWPARMDPFHAFASYPTRTLTPQTRLALVDTSVDAAMARVTQYMSLTMVDFAKHVLPSVQEIESVLNAAQEQPQSAESLIRNIAVERKPYVLRSLSWLVKLGVLSVSVPGHV